MESCFIPPTVGVTLRFHQQREVPLDCVHRIQPLGQIHKTKYEDVADRVIR